MKTYEELVKMLGTLKVRPKAPDDERMAAAAKGIREALDSSPVAASCYLVSQPAPMNEPQRFDCEKCRKRSLFITAAAKRESRDAARCADVLRKCGIQAEVDLSVYCPECNPGGPGGNIPVSFARPRGPKAVLKMAFFDLRLLCAFASGEKITAEDYGFGGEEDIKLKLSNILKKIYSE